MTKQKILIATGGTGGHIFPAYSLANKLEANYNVVLTTDTRGLNYLKDYKNLNIIEIPSSPLKKKNVFTLIYSILIISFSIFKSLLFLLISRPKIIFGMGGYASFPVCVAATILRIKFVIYENNLVIGKANKYLLPFSKKIFVSYKELEGIAEKYNEKIFVIGNIIRDEIIRSKKTNIKTNEFQRMSILVLGGSQAAKIFADELPPIFEKLKKKELPFKIYQQCQKKQNEKLSKIYDKAKVHYEIFNFTNKIIDYYLKANLVITRSGASVLGELINVKMPFISIPLPTSADDHQNKNAMFYEKKGYGLLVREKDIKNKLYDLILKIFEDNSLLGDIIYKQEQYSDKDIFKTLNFQIDKIINEKN